MTIHPRHKRSFRQILAFGLIWLAFGLIYVLLESGLLATLEEYPATGNKYDFRTSLDYASIFSFLTGLPQGAIEVFWLKRRLSKFQFWKKILLKSLFYLIFLLLFPIALTLITNAQRYGKSIFDSEILVNLRKFMKSFAFWSVIIYCGVILDIALFYSEMRDYLGNGVQYNCTFGKYHKPKKEVRIFMFLDMKSSTAIAERIGHEKL